MKTAVYPMVVAIISFVAVGLCFVPVLFLSLKKIRKVNAYCVIAIYWLLTGLISLPSQFSFPFLHGKPWPGKWSDYFTLAETPLLLLVFAFASAGSRRKWLLILLSLFVAGEAVLLTGWDCSLSSRTIILWAGVLPILTYSIGGLIRYVKKMEHTRFETSMVFVYAALLFAYGSFLIIYVFAHLPPDGAGSGEADSYLLYYISLLLSATVTSTGLWSYGIRRSPAGRPALTSPAYSSSSS